MQVVFRNVDLNGTLIANPDASLVADESTAATILNSTITNNITVTINVGLGFNPATGNTVTGSGSGGPNANTEVELNYEELRTALLNSGQPNFFTATNLPAGDNLPVGGRFSISNFWISSSQQKAFGLPPSPNAGVDGSIGIGDIPAGPDRVATILHEVGHVMGRMPGPRSRLGVQYYPELDLVRFFSAGNRITLASGGGYFSIDGGTTRVVNWSFGSAADFADPPNNTAFGPRRLDPYNATLVDGNTLGQLTPLDLQVMEALGFTTTLPVINPAPPPATTAVMVLRQTSVPPTITDGTYQIYDLGNNQILANYQLGKVGPPWQFVTLGGFNDGDTSDVMLRNATTNQFLLYDIAPNNNNFTPGGQGISLIPPGALGSEWEVLAFGNFSSIPGETDMMLRRSSDGLLLIDDIRNNQITGSFFTGPVGTDWQFSGVGNFSSNPDGVARDLMLRRVSDGALQVYNFANNQLTNSFSIGPVGPDYKFSGVGNFSSNPGESDLLLRLDDPALPNNGALQLYDIANNRLGPSFALGTVGPDFQFAGVASIRGAGAASDLILRRASDGFLQGYNIANNALGAAPALGATGSEWQLPQFPAGGFAANPRSASTASMGDSGQATQLAQAMADHPVDPSSFSSAMVNPAPPEATTADMVLRNASNPAASYQIYNLGANRILAANSLAQVGSDWGFVTLGNFNLDDPSDMLLRNSTSGAFQAYEIVNNNVISSNSMGAVGVNWQVMGFGIFGPFSGFGETDMMLRNADTGDLQVYDIFDNKIVDSASIGNVGLQWQFSGIGNFGSSGNSDLLVRNSNTGELQVNNISNNEITGSESLGTIGTEWEFSGVGNFSSAWIAAPGRQEKSGASAEAMDQRSARQFECAPSVLRSRHRSHSPPHSLQGHAGGLPPRGSIALRSRVAALPFHALPSLVAGKPGRQR
jgi:hypothetical protein